MLYIVIYLCEDLPASSLARNLLLPISIGLSPLYPALPSDLQISEAWQEGVEHADYWEGAETEASGIRVPALATTIRMLRSIDALL